MTGARALIAIPMLAVAAAAALGAARPADAVELPLWEAGVGPTGLYLPDYRGSNQSRGYVYPLPYVIYRGERFRIDRDRLRQLLFGSDRLELEVNANGNVPVKSSRDEARNGMPDLDPVAEIGPGLKYTAWKSDNPRRELTLRLPARAAFAVATNFSHVHFIGWVFQPGIGMDWYNLNLAGSPGWNTGVIASVIANTRHYNQYYYSVQPAFATPERAAYDAPGGSAGEQLTFTLSKRFTRFWMGAFARYDSVRGGSFTASPLVRTRQNIEGGVAVAWIFGQSDRMVDVP